MRWGNWERSEGTGVDAPEYCGGTSLLGCPAAQDHTESLGRDRFVGAGWLRTHLLEVKAICGWELW